MIDAALVLSIGGSIHSCTKAPAIYYQILGFKGEYSQLQTSDYSSIYFYEGNILIEHAIVQRTGFLSTQGIMN